MQETETLPRVRFGGLCCPEEVISVAGPLKKFICSLFLVNLELVVLLRVMSGLYSGKVIDIQKGCGALAVGDVLCEDLEMYLRLPQGIPEVTHSYRSCFGKYYLLCMASQDAADPFKGTGYSCRTKLMLEGRVGHLIQGLLKVEL